MNALRGRLDKKDLKSAKWRLAIDSKVYAQNLESSNSRRRARARREAEQAATRFIPIRFIFTNKLGRRTTSCCWPSMPSCSRPRWDATGRPRQDHSRRRSHRDAEE